MRQLIQEILSRHCHFRFRLCGEETTRNLLIRGFDSRRVTAKLTFDPNFGFDDFIGGGGENERDRDIG